MRPAAAAPSRPDATSPLEESAGFSSLLLLASPAAGDRTLLLLEWTQGAVAVRTGGALRWLRFEAGGWTRLPLATSSIDTVVVDLDAVPARRLQTAVATELRRILGGDGRCVAAVTRGRVPRDPRAWRRYRFVPGLDRWKRAVARSGLELLAAVPVAFDGARIDTLYRMPPRSDGRPAPPARTVALVLGSSSGPRESVLDVISDELRERGSSDGIELVHVRKIGKAAAFVTVGSSRMLVRLPCSPTARQRAEWNYAALEALHGGAGRVPLLLVPRPVCRNTVASQPYFLESCVGGSPRVPPRHGPSWEPQALEFITDLHRSTAQRRRCDGLWFDRTIADAIRALDRSPLIAPTERAVLEPLGAKLRELFEGQEVPFVRSHGDFTGANCLYDARGRLTGVVDWELSRRDALPMLDLLQCFDIPDEYTADGRWRRADLVFDAFEGRGPLAGAFELTRYLDALALPAPAASGLLLMHWVDHVAARIEARGRDRRWFRHRVEGPLRRLSRLLR